MTPRIGVTEAMSTTEEKARLPVTPMPTPTSEDTSGSAAPSRLRSMISSTRPAMTTPVTSPGPSRPSVLAASSLE